MRAAVIAVTGFAISLAMALLPAAAPEAKRVYDREYQEYKSILTEPGMSKL